MIASRAETIPASNDAFQMSARGLAIPVAEVAAADAVAVDALLAVLGVVPLNSSFRMDMLTPVSFLHMPLPAARRVAFLLKVMSAH